MYLLTFAVTYEIFDQGKNSCEFNYNLEGYLNFEETSFISTIFKEINNITLIVKV